MKTLNSTAMLEWLIALPRAQKRVVVLLLDAVLCIVSTWIAISLRIGEWMLWNEPVQIYLAAALALWLPIFYAMGVYQAIFRVAGAGTMIGLARSSGLYAVPLIAIFMVYSLDGVPRTLPILQPLIFFVLLCLSRITARYLLIDVLGRRLHTGIQRRVLIYGAGASGRQLAASIRHEPSMALCAYIDDDVRLDNQMLDGLRIFTSARLDECIERLAITDILLAIPGTKRSRRQQILKNLQRFPVHVQTLPNVRALVDGKVSISDLRELRVEDLLGRDPVPPNELLMGRTIFGKTVLVTGAGGSIGGELCRQILRLGPSQLILAEMTEYALYTIDQELRMLAATEPAYANIGIVPLLVNVCDEKRLAHIFKSWRPATVFHAAAYKHVPLVETNCLEGLRNNVFGTLNAAVQAKNHGVANFILISTDKAVRPTNVMGASKRVCELILQALASESDSTKFAMVRFGNVLGSSGSVVPRFEKQIRGGGPVTLTHHNVTRYFMTIAEAAQLVIQAGAMARGGDVYVLDMGKPVKIKDLAHTMIRLAGLTVRDESNPSGDIAIIETGLRPGEKLYEELLIGDNPRPTKHPRIMQATEYMVEWRELEAALGILVKAVEGDNETRAMDVLSQLVPEYCSQRQAAGAKEA